MRAQVFHGPGDLRFEEVPEPSPEPMGESHTMGPEGALGLAPEVGVPIARRSGSPARSSRSDTAAS